MSELGGSEWDDREAEIQETPEPDSPWPMPYEPEGPEGDDRNTLEPENDDDCEFGILEPEEDFPEPAGAPPSLAELELLGEQDEAEGDTPLQDDWNDLARDLKAFLTTAKDTPFSGNELEDVRDALRDAQEQLADLKGLNDEQVAMIRDLSERLDRSSEHLGRKDWVIAVIGAGTALVIAGVVPPLFMLHIGVKFIHEIGHLFK